MGPCVSLRPLVSDPLGLGVHFVSVLVDPHDVGVWELLACEQMHPGVVVEVAAVGPERVGRVVALGAELPEIDSFFVVNEEGLTTLANRSHSSRDPIGRGDARARVQQNEDQLSVSGEGLGDECDLVGHRSRSVRHQSPELLAQGDLGEVDLTDIRGLGHRLTTFVPAAHVGRVIPEADAGPTDQVGVMQLDGECLVIPCRRLCLEEGGEGFGSEPVTHDQLSQVVPEGEVAGKRLSPSLEGPAVQKLFLRAGHTHTDLSSFDLECSRSHVVVPVGYPIQVRKS